MVIDVVLRFEFAVEAHEYKFIERLKERWLMPFCWTECFQRLLIAFVFLSSVRSPEELKKLLWFLNELMFSAFLTFSVSSPLFLKDELYRRGLCVKKDC